MADTILDVDITQGKSRTVTIQPKDANGNPSNNAENLSFNPHPDLEFSNISATAPFTVDVKAVGGIGQNPLANGKFDGDADGDVVEVFFDLQFHITAPQAVGTPAASVGPEF